MKITFKSINVKDAVFDNDAGAFDFRGKCGGCGEEMSLRCPSDALDNTLDFSCCKCGNRNIISVKEK